MNKCIIELEDAPEGVQYTVIISNPADPTSPSHQFAAALNKFPEMLTEFMQTCVNRLSETKCGES